MLTDEPESFVMEIVIVTHGLFLVKITKIGQPEEERRGDSDLLALSRFSFR